VASSGGRLARAPVRASLTGAASGRQGLRDRFDRNLRQIRLTSERMIARAIVSSAATSVACNEFVRCAGLFYSNHEMGLPSRTST